MTGYIKRTGSLRVEEASLAELGPDPIGLARAEGLPAHAKSVALRIRANR